jgi:hypothetical protein
MPRTKTGDEEEKMRYVSVEINRTWFYGWLVEYISNTVATIFLSIIMLETFNISNIHNVNSFKQNYCDLI